MRARQTILALSLAASGCFGSHEAADPVPLALFCDSFFDALCEPLAQCGCGDAVELECRGRQRELCAGFPSAALLASHEAGRIRYDGAEAAALFRRMRERAASCESFVGALDWRVRDLFTVGGVFEGTVAAGQPCAVLGFELISECEMGSCAPDRDVYVCRAAVGEGERCDALHVCADLDRELSLELGIEGLSMRCVGDAGSGTCAPLVPPGGACASADDCETAMCELGACALLDVGEACSLSRQCASGNCDRGACMPGELADVAACASATACASGVCAAGTCLSQGCGTF